MNVGDYVRTKYGITQFKEYETTNGSKFLCMPVKDGSQGIFVNVEDVIKSSPNIIDLIKYGDIVKYKIDDEEFISEVWGEKNDYFVQNFDVPIDLRDLNIVSIVTKEQFENCMYKIGE